MYQIRGSVQTSMCILGLFHTVYLSGKGREVFLGIFLYYKIEYILELLGRPFHMFLGALNTTSLF